MPAHSMRRFRRPLLTGLFLAFATTMAFAVDPLSGPNADPTRASAPEANVRPSPTVLDACNADAQKFCADVAAGGGRKLACLDSHRIDLAPTCRDALSKIDGRKRPAATK